MSPIRGPCKPMKQCGLQQAYSEGKHRGCTGLAQVGRSGTEWGSSMERLWRDAVPGAFFGSVSMPRSTFAPLIRHSEEPFFDSSSRSSGHLRVLAASLHQPVHRSLEVSLGARWAYRITIWKSRHPPSFGAGGCDPNLGGADTVDADARPKQGETQLSRPMPRRLA